MADLWGGAKADPEAYFTTSQNFGSWSSTTTNTTDTSVPFAAASSFVYSDDDGRVGTYYSLDLVRAVDNGASVYPELTTNGISSQRPAIAYGTPDTLMVGWVEQSNQANEPRLRVASRVGGTMGSSTVPMTTRYAEFGLGYDKLSDRFLLTFIEATDSSTTQDAIPRVAVLLHDGTRISNVSLEAELGHVAATGKVACNNSGDCVFPFTEAGVYWPLFGLVRGHVASSQFVFDEKRVLGYLATSYVDVAMGDDNIYSSTNEDRLIFTFTNSTTVYGGEDAWWVGSMLGFWGGPSFVRFNTTRTPVALGSFYRDFWNPTEYRVYHGDNIP